MRRVTGFALAACVFAFVLAANASARTDTSCPTSSNQSGKNLSGASFNTCKLAGFDFSGANLSKATFAGATLTNANFRGANLNQTDFSNAKVDGAAFDGDNLNQTTFVAASGTHATFTGANMNGAALDHGNFSYANVTGANTNKATCVGTNVYALVGKLSCAGSVSVPPDTTAPTIHVPSAITAEATSTSRATVAYAVTVTDNADPGPSLSCAPVSGSTFALGTTTVACASTDASGNTAHASFTVTVRDTTPPALTLPSHITAEATGANGAAVLYSVAASDTVDGAVTPSCSPSSGSTFVLGTTTVHCSATDAHANAAAGSFTVDVQDTSAPLVTVPADIDVPQGSPEGATVTFSATANDSVDGPLTATCDPVAGSIFPVGNTTVTCSATDSGGNTGSSRFVVTVEPHAVPGAPTVTGALPGNGSALITFLPPARDGGSPITTYTVTSSPGGITATGAVSPITVPGLTAGVSYTFSVTASNLAGSSSASAPSAAVVPFAQSVPGAPTDVRAIAAPGGATVSFEPPAVDGGAPITVYTVISSPGGVTATGSSSPIAVSGLTERQSYTFTVTATTSIGTSPASASSPPVVLLPATLNVSGPAGGVAGITIQPAAIPATLSGEAAAAGGTITFTVFGPQTTAPSSCASGGTVVGTTAVHGDGSYQPPTGFTPPVTGTYWWYATYSGDGSNAAADSACGGSVPGSPYSTAQPGLTPNPTQVAYSPNGAFLVTANIGLGTVSVFSVDPSTGVLAQVPGSPFSVGGGGPTEVAFNPGGTLLAVDIETGIAMFSVNPATGVLTQVPGSPFPDAGDPESLAFSPTGALLAVANLLNTVSVFSVDQATGALSQVTGSPFAGDASPFSVAFSPTGALLAVAALGARGVSMYSVNQATGRLTQVPGSPFSVPGYPLTVAFDPTGALLATTNAKDFTASPRILNFSMFAVDQTTGRLTQDAASPYAAAGPLSLAFSPDGGRLATANADGTVGLYSIDPTTDGLAQLTGFAPGVPFGAEGVAFAPGGRFLATAIYTVGVSVQPLMISTVVTTVPAAPTGVSASPGNGRATVSFTPGETGGLPVSSYTVTASPGGLTVSASSSPVTVLGLTPGVSYTFTVTANNPNGSSPGSSPSAAALVTEGPPGAPTGVSAVNGQGQATVSFTAPVSNGGRAITSYTVTSSPGGITANAAAGPITVSGLTPGVSYTFAVVATNSDGPGVASPASNAVTPTGVPNAPVNVVATSGPGRATISFNAPANSGGLPVTSFTVTSSPGGLTMQGSSPVTISGLTPGVSYTFTVKATNALGAGPASTPSNAVTPTSIGAPSPPSHVTAVAADSEVRVSFVAPDDGGSPITQYNVTAEPGDETASGTSSPITVTGLTNGQSYTFTVTAVNAFGSSPASTQSAPATPGVPLPIELIYNPAFGYIDVATGDIYQFDGSELDPVTFEELVPPPANPPTVIFLPADAIIVTADAGSGVLNASYNDAYPTAYGYETYLDLPDHLLFDTNGSAFEDTSGIALYELTSNGNLVDLNASSEGNWVILDPQTLDPVAGSPFGTFTPMETPTNWELP